jgi:hypothetical protein
MTTDVVSKKGKVGRGKDIFAQQSSIHFERWKVESAGTTRRDEPIRASCRMLDGGSPLAKSDANDVTDR